MEIAGLLKLLSMDGAAGPKSNFTKMSAQFTFIHSRRMRCVEVLCRIRGVNEPLGTNYLYHRVRNVVVSCAIIACNSCATIILDAVSCAAITACNTLQ